MSQRPFWIAGAAAQPDEALMEHSLATIRAALPPSLLVLFALHLDAMKKERAFGHVGVEFHMHRGDVKSAAFNRRTTWQSQDREPKP